MEPYILTGFADEAAVALDAQMDVLAANDIRYIEMRTVDGKGVLSLTEAELHAIKAKLDARGFKISAIGSPIGKTPITGDFAEVKASFQLAVRAAKMMECPYIRGFSFYMPKGEAPENYADEVVARLRVLAETAGENGLIYALENEKGIFTDITARCVYVFDRIQSPAFKMVFDPANFIHDHVQPYPTAYQALKKQIAYFHIKDATHVDGHFRIMPSGEGDADMAALLQNAFADGFRGFLSLEPHLGGFTALTEAERFSKAADALKKTLCAVQG